MRQTAGWNPAKSNRHRRPSGVSEAVGKPLLSQPAGRRERRKRAALANINLHIGDTSGDSGSVARNRRNE